MKKKYLLPGTLPNKPVDHSRRKVNPLSMNLPLKNKQASYEVNLKKQLQKTTQIWKSAKRELSREFSVVDKEIKKRKTMVERLNKEASEAELIKDLYYEQIQTVLSISEKGSAEERKKSNSQAILINIIFLVLNMVLTLILSRI